MSISINRRSPSPYFDGSSYELFEAIADNNMRFQHLQHEVHALSSSIAKEIGERQASVQKKIEEIESKLGSLQSQIHVVHRELAKQRAMHAEGFQQLTARMNEQDKYLASLGQKVDGLMRMMSSGPYAPYSYHPSSSSSYPYSQ